MDYAPIVLFTYNRPQHTKRILDSLRRNHLARHSTFYVFSDGPKTPTDKELVAEVRRILYELDGFKKIEVIESRSNQGLARSIISGVSQVIEIHGKAIVLEDDLVTSDYFLDFMNNALRIYKDEAKVWHISGWNYPIETDGLPEAFFWRVMNCWGWATWADRWRHYEKNPKRLIEEWDEERIKRFNLDGAHNFWEQVLKNASGEIDTWAIFWYATIFEHNGLCLNPSQSFVQNIGFDGSGIHCGKESQYITSLRTQNITQFPLEVRENELAVERIKEFYEIHSRPSYWAKIKGVIKRMLGLVEISG